MQSTPDTKSVRGNVTISRVYSTERDSPIIQIKIDDERSGVQFVCADIALDDFAKLVTGQGHIPAALELRHLDRVGLLREHKTEIVRYKRGANQLTNIRLAAEAMAEFEVDGWRGRLSDCGNWHRYDEASDGYRVTFTRWVDDDEA